MKFFTPERLYSFFMFILSLVLAGFLVGLGGLIIKDLPRVQDEVRLEQFVDQEVQKLASDNQTKLRQENTELQTKRSLTQTKLDDVNRAYQIGASSFRSWAATRSTTGDDSQNDELIRRSEQLDGLRSNLAEAQNELSQIQAKIRTNTTELNALRTQESKRFDEARPAYEKAKFVQNATVFAFRLAITLPLILIAIWFIKTKRQSAYWPIYRGFVIFALFVFFVELVPYLPSYGGYVRYLVGIVLTLLAGYYLVRWMKGYLEERQRERLVSEKERRQSLDYDAAVNKANKGICPGCERSVATVDDVKPDYCAHCGLMLYENCSSCATRKLVFHHFCLKCGIETKETPA